LSSAPVTPKGEEGFLSFQRKSNFFDFLNTPEKVYFHQKTFNKALEVGPWVAGALIFVD